MWISFFSPGAEGILTAFLGARHFYWIAFSRLPWAIALRLRFFYHKPVAFNKNAHPFPPPPGWIAQGLSRAFLPGVEYQKPGNE